MAIEDKLSILSQTPHILKELVDEIPIDQLKVKRQAGRWCIHEHVCHLFEALHMMLERFKTFKRVKNPSFKPYLPGTNDVAASSTLIDMNMDKCLIGFKRERMKLLELLKSYDKDDWKNEGSHPEYVRYNPAIFLRHIMMQDHLHMYRIEELWLTTNEFIGK